MVSVQPKVFRITTWPRVTEPNAIYFLKGSGNTFVMYATGNTNTPELLVAQPGKSAYEVAVENGFSGTEAEWLTSLTTGGILLIENETPIGAINGSNATFTTLNNFVPGTETVYYCGVRMKKLEDYNTSGTTTITLFFSPNIGDNLLVDYIKQ